ncbi:MAG: T9SS type A sorting domain-containing protein [Spirosoma sp.]|nr:T9SS type A sorting domain-containing protein [Spirosoma sp.]
MARSAVAQSTPALTIVPSAATACSGASVTLTASGCPAGGALVWSTAQTGGVVVVVPTQTVAYQVVCSVTSSSVVTTTAVSGTATSGTATSGTAIVSTTALVTSTASTSATTTIQVNPPISISATVGPVSCNRGADGRVTINATGGTAPFQYQFNTTTFQTANGYTGLIAGVYPVAVRDARGCTVQTTAQVRQPDALTLSITAVGAKCTGGSDGGIIAVPSGGNGTYRFFLNTTPRDNGTFFDLKGDSTYTIGVVDRLSCVYFESVKITQPPAFQVALTPQPTRCAGSVDGSITVAASGGSGAYQYQIGTNAFQTGSQFTGLSASTYAITVRDANGCLTKASAAVTQPTRFQLSAVSRPVNCFGPSSGTITVSFTGGTGAPSYRLTTAQTAQASNVFTGVGVGGYSIVGTDANGCTEVTSVTVGQAAPLNVRAVPTSASCCVCPTGAITLTSTGGSGTARQYQVLGQPAQPAPRITGLRPNTYRLRVIDEVGCADTTTAVVTDANVLTLTIGTIKNTPCAGGSAGEAAVQVAGGARPFTYYWITERKDTLRSRTATQTGLIEGTYTVSVTDSNRCTTSTVFITVRATALLPDKPVVQQSGGALLVDQTAGIQWFVRQGADPARPVPNATRPILTPFESGQYYAVVTTSGCASPPSNVIDFVLTATPEPLADFVVHVAPNPVRGQLRVELEQAGRSAVGFQLLDASGRAVWQQQLPAFTGKKQAEWPLTGIQAGSYLLRADADSRRTTVRVVVE